MSHDVALCESTIRVDKKRVNLRANACLSSLLKLLCIYVLHSYSAKINLDLSVISFSTAICTKRSQLNVQVKQNFVYCFKENGIYTKSY